MFEREACSRLPVGRGAGIGSSSPMKLFPALRAVGLAGLVVTLSVSRLMAQDVTVSDPAWFEPEKPGADVLPAFKKKPSPDYPRELKKDQPGYVIVSRFIGEDGAHIRGRQWSSHPYLNEEITWENGVKFLAATKDGKPVSTLVWYAAIFNPKTAAVKGPDAVPRLLAVSPVVVSKETLAKVPDAKEGQATVGTTLLIDASGVPRVKAFDVAEHEALRETIEKVLTLWKFAPARRGGQAVEAEMPLTFWVTRAPKPTLGATKADKMPQVISQGPPVYPPSLRRTGQQGEVMLEFVIDEKGAVKDVAVVRSDHPAFEEPAIEALQKRKYKPGTAKGKPVPVKMRQAIVFNLHGSNAERGAMQLPEPSAKSQAKLPEELRYDVAPKPKGVLYPAYPFELLMAKTGGKAEVAFLVGADGRVAEIKVIKADRPEFGEALSAAVAAFEFVPALKAGKPTVAMFRMEHEFDAGGWNGRPSSDDLDMVALLRKHPERIAEPKSLDTPLKPISRRAPIFPATAQADSGEALIEVVIDRDGRARLPKIVSATEPALGYAAAQAAGDWRFEEPKVGGKPVVVRARVPFKFGAAKKPEPAKDASGGGAAP
jgi:TonB family protein